MKKVYVFRKEADSGVYVLDLIRKEEALVFAILGSSFISSNREALSENCILEVLDTLTDTEKKIVMFHFRFSDECKTVKELSEKIGCSVSRINQIERKAFRKLRHPSRCRKLLERKGSTQRVIYPKREYYGRDVFDELDGMFKDILLKEIKSKFLRKDSSQLGMLEKIVVMNNISVVGDGGGAGEDIDELDLSVRAYNVLKKSGISTVQELLYAIDTLDTIEGIGKETYKEIMSVVIKCDYKKKYPIVVYRNNDGYQITSDWKSEEERVEAIYELLKKHGEPYGLITERKCSWGLMSLLLMKGYLFVDNIVEEYSKIAGELILSGFENYANELYCLVEEIMPYKIIPELRSVKIIKVNSKIAQAIIRKKPADCSQLLECCDIDDKVIEEEQRSCFKEAFALNDNFVIPENI